MLHRLSKMLQVLLVGRDSGAGRIIDSSEIYFGASGDHVNSTDKFPPCLASNGPLHDGAAEPDASETFGEDPGDALVG